jgi:hypothetical protein
MLNITSRHLEAIHQALQASGYRPRTKEQVDAQIQAERDSWGTICPLYMLYERMHILDRETPFQL